jgi:hypothetical protein
LSILLAIFPLLKTELTHTSKYTRILGKRRLTLCIHRQQRISNFQTHGIAFEEVRKVDEPFSRCCIGVGDEFVIWQSEAEDVRVDYDDTAGIGPVADYIGVEAMDELLSTFGLARVDGALSDD